MQKTGVFQHNNILRFRSSPTTRCINRVKNDRHYVSSCPLHFHPSPQLLLCIFPAFPFWLTRATRCPLKCNYEITSGFWPRVRARALRAPIFCHENRALRARPPPPIAASLLLIRHPKIYKIYWTWAAHVKGIFSFHWTTCRLQTLWNMRSLPPPRPSQLRWSFRQYFGAKLCTP